MKKMLHYHIMGAVMLLSLSSCSVYQLNTISSPSLVHDEKKGALVQETDSVRISYSFTGEKPSRITIEIFNKLDEPLAVDWQRSALVYKDSSISYANYTGSFSGTSERTYIAMPTQMDRFKQARETQGQITLPSTTNFIPPHSFVKSSPIALPDFPLMTVPDTSFQYFPLQQKEFTPAKSLKATFTISNSPLLLTSYLTLNNNQNPPASISYVHSFYVSEIIQTKARPANTYYIEEQPGIRFYMAGTAQSAVNQLTAVRTPAITTTGNVATKTP